MWYTYIDGHLKQTKKYQKNKTKQKIPQKPMPGFIHIIRQRWPTTNRKTTKTCEGVPWVKALATKPENKRPNSHKFYTATPRFCK